MDIHGVTHERVSHDRVYVPSNASLFWLLFGIFKDLIGKLQIIEMSTSNGT